MMFMDAIHVHDKKGKGTLPLKQMIPYEQCMKVIVVLNPMYTREMTTRRIVNTRL